MKLVSKSFGFHLVREITIAGFLYMTIVEKLVWENPKVFHSFTLTQTVVSRQVFVERGSTAWQNGVLFL